MVRLSKDGKLPYYLALINVAQRPAFVSASNRIREIYYRHLSLSVFIGVVPFPHRVKVSKLEVVSGRIQRKGKSSKYASHENSILNLVIDSHADRGF